MIQYLQNENIDKERWDQCIKRSFNGLIYGYSWYLDIMADNWDALVDENYDIIFPLSVRKRFGKEFLIQPSFTSQLGIFSGKILPAEIIQKYLGSIPRKLHYGKIHLNTFNKINPENYKASQGIIFEMDLINDYEGISGNYRTNLSELLKKTNKIFISKNINPEEIIRLVNEQGRKKLSRREYDDLPRLKRIVYMAIYKGLAAMYGAFNDKNELIGGAIFLISHKKAILHFITVNNEFTRNHIRAKLIDTFIRDNAGKHLTLAINYLQDAKNAKIYEGFGAIQTSFPVISFGRIPWII
ncbi:MAG: hypothetical protein K8R53_00735 [Bacteroidales bacterium]|nr:hypothetical protein [Bacteroidales bacterium]